MYKSRYNLITQIDSENSAVFNPLSGAFDIADNETVKRFTDGKPLDDDEQEYWFTRGYFFGTAEEEQNYIEKRYNDFHDEVIKSEVQFVFVPTYSCNFSCGYCYQKGVDRSVSYPSHELIDNMVDYMVNFRKENKRDVYLTLFGGEPLQDKKENYDMMEYLVKKLTDNSIGFAVVTNAYNLSKYIKILEKGIIREIHISLDGDKEVHNKRRKTGQDANTFDAIMEGITKAVSLFIPINIRMIIDKETIGTLPLLAERLDKAGFLDLPKTRFKTSLGRNYELINEYMKPGDLFTLDEMYRVYTDLLMQNPILKKLHTPSYFGISHMVDKGEMYIPDFDSCPAFKSEMAFDYSGGIYSCTASVGREDYKVGTFYPELYIDEQKTADWKKRSILTIPECKDCSVGVVCGGGCGVIAKQKNGTVLSPDCKPVKKVMDYGIQFYAEKLLHY